MKNLLTIFFLAIFCTSQVFSQSDSKVLICISKTATAYHDHYCTGLNKCTHSIGEVTIKEAKELGRTPCGFCYKNTQTTSPTTTEKSQALKAQPSNNSSQTCASVQCSGITQKGARCKNRTTNCNGRCYTH